MKRTPDPDVLAGVRIIESAVAEEFDVSVPVMRARRGQRIHTNARHVVMLLARQLLPGASVPQISLALDRDHTTMLSGLQRLDDVLKRDRVLAERVARLKTKLISLLAAPRTPNGKLASHLARDIGRELGRAFAEEIANQVAVALQPVIYAMLSSTGGTP
ncbi:MAG TPA: helix-turn-helix domain-containing protein [Stellaceae bacterium]